MNLLAHVHAAVAEVLKLQGPADVVLRRYFKAHERLGRRDRGTIAETVFDVLRQRRLYAHWAASLRGSQPERLAHLSLAARLDASTLQGMGLGDQAESLYTLVRSDTQGLPQAVRLSLPDWLHAALARSLARTVDVTVHDSPAQDVAAGGNAANDVAADDVAADDVAADDVAADDVAADDSPVVATDVAPSGGDIALSLEALGRALLEPAPLDLRVNALRAQPDQVIAALRDAGIDARMLAPVASALRVTGKPAIERLPAFEQGWFEVQDVGSQALVEFCGVRRGQTVVDFCAGAGGKTLAMAAQMHNRGQIFACDTSPVRLARMKPRLARSGATNVQPFGIEHERDARLSRLVGRADRVLVDAPCSGTGTLRRNPEVKWRLTEQDLLELSRKQLSILSGAARLVRRGGTLIYATCSLLYEENDQIAETFTREHPGFERDATMRLLPGLAGEPQGDGFFATRWVRRDVL